MTSGSTDFIVTTATVIVIGYGGMEKEEETLVCLSAVCKKHFQ